MNKTILVDMDGVLADFDSHVVCKYEELYGKDDHVFDLANDRKHFYMSQNYGLKFGKEAERRVKKITETEGFFLNLAPIDGGIAALKEMNKLDDVNVILCTSPLSNYRYVLYEKFAWVEKYLGREWIKKIVLTRDKTVVNGHILIDDRPVIMGSNPNPVWQHVLFDQPYNRHLDEKIRISSWGEWKHILSL